MSDITDKEFEKIYLPVCINYDNYLKEFAILHEILLWDYSKTLA